MWTIRMARPEDATTIARHRAEMFREMGDLPDHLFDDLTTVTGERLPELIASGTYVAWLTEGDGPGGVVAGVGLYLRNVLPRPGATGSGSPCLIDREGIVLNAWTEPGHRRKGLARAMMSEALAWARANGITRVVLHASAQGRPLYEQLGFQPTNEMRLVAPEAADGAGTRS